MSPLVSIVTPCLNASRWLRACVDSALAQTWMEKEIIVVDDGSTDESLAILRGYGDALHVIASPHAGAPHARNAGLAAARGEWVQFLDADDYLEPPKIASQLAEAREEADVLYSPAIVETWRDDRASERVTHPLDPASDLYERWFTFQLPQTGAALWRADAIRRIGGWNEAMPCGQDHELYLRALQAELRFHATDSSHAVYRIWSEETLCRKDPLLVIEVRTKLVLQLVAWLRDSGRLTPRNHRAAGRACFEMARQLARHDMTQASDYHAARRCEGLIALDGPAAPPLYRLAYHTLGFAAAERIARLRRS